MVFLDLACCSFKHQAFKVVGWRPSLLGARTLLGAPGLTTRNKRLLGAPGIATSSKDASRLEAISSRSKDATRGSTRNKKLLGTIRQVGPRSFAGSLSPDSAAENGTLKRCRGQVAHVRYPLPRTLHIRHQESDKQLQERLVSKVQSWILLISE